MSYETSPSALLVASQCACCGKTLSDAPSIESGMGPLCRKKHGYATPEGTADLTAALAAIGPHMTALALPVDATSDARRLANLLVHRIAVLQDGEVAAACVDGIRALGFETLGDRCAKRMTKIVVRVEDDEKTGDTTIVVKAPYSDGGALRSLPGRRWDGATKTTRIRVYRSMEGAKTALLAALAADFPGAWVDGPTGLFLLPRGQVAA